MRSITSSKTHTKGTAQSLFSSIPRSHKFKHPEKPGGERSMVVETVHKPNDDMTSALPRCWDPEGGISGLSWLRVCVQRSSSQSHCPIQGEQMQGGEKKGGSLLFLSTALNATGFSTPSHTGQVTEQDLSWHPRGCPHSPSCSGHQVSRADSCAVWAGGPSSKLAQLTSPRTMHTPLPAWPAFHSDSCPYC